MHSSLRFTSLMLLLLLLIIIIIITTTTTTTTTTTFLTLHQERHMHCSLSIITSMTDSWNMTRNYVEGAPPPSSPPPHTPSRHAPVAAEACNILGCQDLISSFKKIKSAPPVSALHAARGFQSP